MINHNVKVLHLVGDDHNGCIYSKATYFQRV